MGEIKDLTGSYFGKLTVLERVGVSKDRQITWLCECKCGNTTIVRGGDLRNGHTKSCGCLNKERITTHGMSAGKNPSKTYTAWRSMRQRCNNPKHKHFDDYGGRGIIVCNEWNNSFETFFEDMGECPDGMSLDRINNNGNYDPNNCRWATQKEQCNNRRDNVILTFLGDTGTMPYFAEKYGIRYTTLKERLRSGWPIEKALVTPVRGK